MIALLPAHLPVRPGKCRPFLRSVVDEESAPDECDGDDDASEDDRDDPQPAVTHLRGSIHCSQREHTLWSQPGAYTVVTAWSIHCGQREHTLCSKGAYTAVRGSIHCGHSLEHTLWSQPGAYTAVRGSIHCSQREHTLQSEGAYTVVRGSIHCSHREHISTVVIVTGSISVL